MKMHNKKNQNQVPQVSRPLQLLPLSTHWDPSTLKHKYFAANYGNYRLYINWSYEKVFSFMIKEPIYHVWFGGPEELKQITIDFKNRKFIFKI